jgi:uncharacterized membrane protein
MAARPPQSWEILGIIHANNFNSCVLSYILVFFGTEILLKLRQHLRIEKWQLEFLNRERFQSSPLSESFCYLKTFIDWIEDYTLVKQTYLEMRKKKYKNFCFLVFIIYCIFLFFFLESIISLQFNIVYYLYAFFFVYNIFLT